jgi:hypothetical protein
MLLKKYSDLGGGNKKFDSEFLSYNLMLNSGKKFILTLVLSEKPQTNQPKKNKNKKNPKQNEQNKIITKTELNSK